MMWTTVACVLMLYVTLVFGATDEEYSSLMDSYIQARDEIGRLQQELDDCIERHSSGPGRGGGTACPPDFIQFQDHCYWFNMQKLDWYDAGNACEQKVQGSKLVSINSQPEQDFLVNQARTNFSTVRTDSFWLGLKMDWARDVQVWEDGSDVTFTQWSPGEPQCLFNGCKVFLSEYLQYKWEDARWQMDIYSICEMVPSN